MKPNRYPLIALAAAFLLLYWPVFRKLLQDWGTDDNYSHGYFIPFIAGYMVWQRRDQLAEVVWKPAGWGLLVLLAGLCQLLLAWVGTEYFLQASSMLLVLFGTALFLAGTAITGQLAIPILYLLFMIPIPAILWNQVAFPMKLFASAAATEVIQAMGYTILREGNVLTLPNITLEVVDACSGLRSLTSLLALSGALAYLSNLSSVKKWILFLAAAPIAILSNVTRLTVTAILAKHYGAVAAEGFLHEFSGWLVFILGLALLLGVQAALASTGTKQPT